MSAEKQKSPIMQTLMHKGIFCACENLPNQQLKSLACLRAFVSWELETQRYGANCSIVYTLYRAVIMPSTVNPPPPPPNTHFIGFLQSEAASFSSRCVTEIHRMNVGLTGVPFRQAFQWSVRTGYKLKFYLQYKY